MTDGSGTWVSRLCKSGEVLYYYNAVTGEWRWPSKNDDENVPARKLVGLRNIFYKYLCLAFSTHDYIYII